MEIEQEVFKIQEDRASSLANNLSVLFSQSKNRRISLYLTKIRDGIPIALLNFMKQFNFFSGYIFKHLY